MAERKRGITVHMLINRQAKVVEYSEATNAREDKGGALTLIKSAQPGTERSYEILGSIAKGSWTRWHHTGVVVSEPSDPIDLDD